MVAGERKSSHSRTDASAAFQLTVASFVSRHWVLNGVSSHLIYLENQLEALGCRTALSGNANVIGWWCHVGSAAPARRREAPGLGA